MEWISVKDRLPEENEYVLCARLQGSMSGYKYILPSVGRVRNKSSWSCVMDWVSVTHWMPLPEPPKQ